MNDIPIYTTYLYKYGEVVNVVPPPKDNQQFIDLKHYGELEQRYIELKKNYGELKTKVDNKKSIFNIFRRKS